MSVLRKSSAARTNRTGIETRENLYDRSGRLPIEFKLSVDSERRVNPDSAARTAETISKWKNGVFSRLIGPVPSTAYDDDPDGRLRNSSATERPSMSAFSGTGLVVTLLTSPYDTTWAISVGIRDEELPYPKPPAMSARRIHGERTVAKWNLRRRTTC